MPRRRADLLAALKKARAAKARKQRGRSKSRPRKYKRASGLVGGDGGVYQDLYDMYMRRALEGRGGADEEFDRAEVEYKDGGDKIKEIKFLKKKRDRNEELLEQLRKMAKTLAREKFVIDKAIRQEDAVDVMYDKLKDAFGTYKRRPTQDIEELFGATEELLSEYPQ
jgi:hypothetical protein